MLLTSRVENKSNTYLTPISKAISKIESRNIISFENNDEHPLKQEESISSLREDVLRLKRTIARLVVEPDEYSMIRSESIVIKRLLFLRIVIDIKEKLMKLNIPIEKFGDDIFNEAIELDVTQWNDFILKNL